MWVLIGQDNALVCYT